MHTGCRVGDLAAIEPTHWISGVLLIAVGMPMSLFAQQTLLNRLSAKFKHFDGSEATSIALPAPNAGGALIYSKSVFVPGTPVANNTIYVTISTTGETQGAADLFRCVVNGSSCNPGFGAASPGNLGRVTLLNEPGGVKVNGVFPGANRVEGWMASPTGAPVAIETAHFYIESNRITGPAGDGCGLAP